MKDIREIINENTINESRINYWMVVDYDTDVTYLVAAATIDEAKSLVENASRGNGEALSAWLINDLFKTKSPRIVYDSDAVKVKGDKKY